jgi:hypothetical protein
MAIPSMLYMLLGEHAFGRRKAEIVSEQEQKGFSLY